MSTSILTVSNGSTPATPSTGKTVVFANSNKRLSQVDDAGNVLVLGGGSNAASQLNPTDPTGTTSSVGVMMGLAGSITPATTGRVLITLSGDIANATVNDGANVQLYIGTGTAPANAAALVGTALGAIQKLVQPIAAFRVPFSLQVLNTGLSVGTTYWLDCSLAVVTGGTATIKDLSLTAVEI